MQVNWNLGMGENKMKTKNIFKAIKEMAQIGIDILDVRFDGGYIHGSEYAEHKSYFNSIIIVHESDISRQ